MKNVDIVVPLRPSFRVPLKGVHLSGWAVRYLSGIERPDIEPGFWLSQWFVGKDAVDFGFEPELHMTFDEETEARKASEFLRERAEIETEVVRIG